MSNITRQRIAKEFKAWVEKQPLVECSSLLDSNGSISKVTDLGKYVYITPSDPKKSLYRYKIEIKKIPKKFMRWL